jgi:hypothetical protein
MMRTPTEDQVEEKQVRNHERKCKVKQGVQEGLLGCRGERKDKAFCDGVQQSKCAECCDSLLEHIQRANPKPTLST